MSSSRTLSPSWIYQPPWAAAANPKHDFSCPLRKMCRALARVLAPPPSTLGLLVSLALGSVFPGSIGFVVYTLQMGNDNFSWSEFCNVYNTFCNHLGFSVGVSIFATILLIFLLWTSLFSFYKRISKQSPPPQLTQAEA